MVMALKTRFSGRFAYITEGGLSQIVLLHLFKIMMFGIGLNFLIYEFGLTVKYIFLFNLVYLVSVPVLVRNKITEGIEYTKFVDIGNYMEQLLYSFRRHSKIGSALQDTVQIFPDGPMEETIFLGIEHINESCTVGNAYQEALGIIEVHYKCSMLQRIHNFMVSVEMAGGNHLKGVDLLIVDRNKWVNRILEGQKGKALVKRNMTLATFLSLAIVGSTLLMIPYEFKVIHSTAVAQGTTLGVLVANYLLWLYVQYKLTGSYIDINHNMTEESVQRYHKKIADTGIGKVKNVITGLILFLIALVGYRITDNVLLALAVLLVGVLLATQKQRSKKFAAKRLSREIMKVFPDWMLSIALQLQSDNVQIAIERSIDNAPLVLREELQLLVNRIEDDPLGIGPFVGFYEKLDLPELQSAMKMLYVMNQYGVEEMGQQIETLVERNSILQDKAEQMKFDDYLAGMGFFVLLPMLLGAVKMLVDMMLLVTNLLSSTAVII